MSILYKCSNCNLETDRYKSERCSKCELIFLQNFIKVNPLTDKKLRQARSKISTLKKFCHYQEKIRERRDKNLDPNRKKKNKDGEGSIDISGYKTITKKGHPNQMDDRGRIREHVYIMSEHLQRPLRKGETVHHKNRDKLDNRIQNLELWDRSQPPGQRVEDKINWCVEFLTFYGYDINKK